MANSGFQSLGLTNYQLQINSLGGKQCRSAYKLALESFMTKALPAEMQDRVRANPLRLLDDKSEKVKTALVDAPAITDFWTTEDAKYQAEVIDALVSVGVTPQSQPRLVRGLDYYTGTIFEFVHADLGAQSGIGGGGRYDGLLAALGGPELTGVGFGVGVDRTLLACEAEGVVALAAGRVQVFVVPIIEEARPVAFGLVSSLRDSGVSADMVFGERGLKGSMKAADKSGAPVALIVGLDEIQNGVVTVKSLSDSSQTKVSMAEVVAHVCAQLGVAQ
jgi:histidyl-tRNA synthetase